MPVSTRGTTRRSASPRCTTGCLTRETCRTTRARGRWTYRRIWRCDPAAATRTTTGTCSVWRRDGPDVPALPRPSRRRDVGDRGDRAGVAGAGRCRGRAHRHAGRAGRRAARSVRSPGRYAATGGDPGQGAGDRGRGVGDRAPFLPRDCSGTCRGPATSALHRLRDALGDADCGRPWGPCRSRVADSRRPGGGHGRHCGVRPSHPRDRPRLVRRRRRLRPSRPHPHAKWTWPHERGPACSKGYMLFAGRLQPLKGPDLAIAALAQVPEELRPHLVVAGEVSQDFADYADELGGMVDRFGLGQYVTFMGSQSRASLAEVLRGALLCLVPSHSETFGLVALESAASGTPVIASAAGGLREAVVHGETGQLMDSRLPNDWASAMIRLLADPELLARMGTVARIHARQYSWHNTAQCLTEVYDRLLDARDVSYDQGCLLYTSP